MIRISALNESDRDGSQSSFEATTKEAKEAEAFAWYNRALILQKQGNILDSESTFQQIIEHPFLLEASNLVENEIDNVVHPGLPLLYSVHKNLAGIAAARKDEKTALHHYLEAVKVDESEVTVWYKIGKLALNIHNYSLAKLAFEQGLECNPNHWPCLDQVITMTYAYLNFWNCLIYIARALEKDCSYMKGIAFRDQIFKEAPDLQPLAKKLFVYCDPIIFRTKVDKEEAQEYIDVAIAIRDKRRELCKPPPPPVIKLPQKVDKYTWKRVGECFLELCKMATDPDKPVSMCRPVDMSDYENIMDIAMETEETSTDKVTSDVDTDSKSKIKVEDQVEENKSNGNVMEPITEPSTKEENSTKNNEAIVPETSEVKLKSDNEGTTAESSQESDFEMAEASSHCSADSLVIINLDSEAESGVTSLSNSQASLSNTKASASQVLQQVAAKASADSSIVESGSASANDPKEKEKAVLSENQVSSTTDIPPASIDKTLELAEVNVIETCTEIPGQSFSPSDQAKPLNSDEPKEATSAEEGTSAENNKATDQKNKQSLLASMIVGDFLPAEDVVPDLDYESLFKDHGITASRSTTPTSRDSSRGQKRKRLHLDDRYGNKRRSARVKNVKEQKQEENVNFQELLQKFVPSSLIQNEEDEDEDMKSDETEPTKDGVAEQNLEVKSDSNMKKDDSTILLSTNEETEVRQFLLSCVKNFGILHLCRKYLAVLAHQDNAKWPEGLARTFLAVFKKIRSNLTFPDLFSEASLNTKVSFAEIGLMSCELMLDQYIKVHGTSNKNASGSHFDEYFNQYYKEDLWFVLFVMGCPGFLKQKGKSYAVRVHWMRGRYFLLSDNVDDAVICFQQTISYLKELEEAEQKVVVKLQNCHTDQIISIEKVTSRTENVQRTHSLDQTQKLFEKEDYDKVIDSLLKTFEVSLQKTPQACISPPERHSQIKLLQKSLFKHGDMQKCVLWGEVVLNESLHYYRKAPTPVHREEWNKTMTEVLSTLHKVFEKDAAACKDLSSFHKIRFTQNLIKLIETMMDVSLNVVDMPIGTVLPWVLLYRLTQFEESKLHAMIADQSDGQACVLEGAISSSLMLLNVAHEYLGRHTWCTKNNGAVLLLFLKVLRKERHKSKLSSSLKEELDVAFEQCVYCLYGHPNKKTKSRRLQEHNATPISLTWMRAQAVFEYFKPATVPEFDSYKTSTVSAELEGLLRRVFVLVPEEIGAVSRIDTVLKYIEGETNTSPSYETENMVLKELYYLLADYYFKNKETSKATRFYQYDLCVNPKRLDSWAGTALSRMSQLEQKLNAMELKLDTPIHKKAIAALRCFKRAVEINETTRTLWIEYGSLAYQLHSHASRQLKMQKWFPLDEELLEVVTETKPEMLQIAHNCYWKASECEADGNEEEWLHHYMMGKVKEKKRAHPKDYLEHYRQAAIYLHEDEAMYPKKMVFSNSPPHLAIEALEVYYRLHAVILKHLLREDGIHDYELYDHYVTEAAASPFAKGREKRQERRESTTEDSCSSNSAYCQSKQRPVYHMTPQDHTYSKKKSSSSGSESDNNYSSVNESSRSHSPTDCKMTTRVTDTTKTHTLQRIETGPFEVTMETENNQKDLEKEEQKSEEKIGGNSEKGGKPEGSSEISNEENQEKPKEVNSEIKANVDEKELSSQTNKENLKSSDVEIEGAVIDLTASDDEPTKDGKSEEKLNVEEKKNATENVQSSELTSMKAEVKLENPSSILIDSSDISEAETENLSKRKVPEVKMETDMPDDKNMKKLSFNTDEERDKMHKELTERCMETLHLCLSRFPNHYKSLYRLAHVYAKSKHMKNLQYAKDILMGNTHWQQMNHMPSPGLFHERKSANFFQGIWKIPVQEIDRSGSFASHMNRSICLLLEVLKELQENRLLYNIHVQLLRVPDTGRKFLRDTERIYLWKQAFKNTIEVLMTKSEKIMKEPDEEKRYSFLMDVYKVWHHGINKLNKFVDITNKVFIKSYKAAVQDKVDTASPIIEQATRFCQNRQSQLSSKLPQIPSQKPSLSSKTQDSQSDSSLFSPGKSDSQSIFFSSPARRQNSIGTPIAFSVETPSITTLTQNTFSSPSTVGSSSVSSPSTPKVIKLTKPTTIPETEIIKTDTPSAIELKKVQISSLVEGKKFEKSLLNPLPSKLTSNTVKSSTATSKPISPVVKPTLPSSASSSPSPVIKPQAHTSSSISLLSHKTSTSPGPLPSKSAPSTSTLPKTQDLSSPTQKSPLSKQSLGTPTTSPHVSSSSGNKKMASPHSPKSRPQPVAPVNPVVETLIESHEEDELLLLSNPDQLTLDIQSFLAHHNL